MQRLKTALVCMGLAGASLPVHAADFTDPEWPCIQRKVETLSMGLMWPHGVESPALDGALAKDVADLGTALSLRRVDMAQAEQLVAEFVASHGRDPAMMTAVFERVFDRLAQRRSRIISGIGDYSLSQIALAERIESARTEMDSLMQGTDPDYDRVDALEEQVDWDERIYTDRQRSLTYVCETPVLLEQRLYAISKLLQAALAG
jgi:hypothetical protein